MAATDNTSIPHSSLDAAVPYSSLTISTTSHPDLTAIPPLPSPPAPSEPAFGNSDEDRGNLLPTDDASSTNSDEECDSLLSTDDETEDESDGAFEERKAFVNSCKRKAMAAQKKEKLRREVLLVNSVQAVKADPSLMKRPRVMMMGRARGGVLTLRRRRRGVVLW
ncbi:hypothetical protein H2199_000980 [Coniosporium tulheliwenetii]|uniref:Uncharacterized protein n=1 Tax=Coniosporium tulheliwenetii TaxID=3383036 RepID=A0ACC2ZNI9_9PEZI|nr:hypothetical protein H2199_000980 [Cladosporium sp. JES 115]